MATIEAVYIVDINGHVILEYPVVATPPSVHSLLPHVINDGFTTMSESTSNVIEISSSRLLFWQKHGTVVFLLACTSEMPAMVPFELINRLVEVLEVYFSTPLIPMKIESHMDTTVLILNEMIEGGVPCTTDPDPMKDLVPYGGLFTKLLSGSGGGTSQTGTVPWRRPNVRYTNNELFVDLVETIYCIVAPTKKQQKTVPSASAFYNTSSQFSTTSKPIVCRIEGAIFIKSHLSGIPQIQLTLDGNAARRFDAPPSFHQCVDLTKWKNSPGTLSFIPADGKSLIASYTINDTSNQGLVYSDFRTGLGVNKDEFEVRVWTLVSREVKTVEGLCINVMCGKNVRHINGMRVTAGDFHISEGGVGEWRFPGKVQLGWNATLRGTLQASEEDDEKVHFPKYMTMSYHLTGNVPTGIKIQNLKIVSTRGLGEGVKPYKGVRYTTQVGEWVVR